MAQAFDLIGISNPGGCPVLCALCKGRELRARAQFGKLGDRRNVPRSLQRQSVIEKPVNVPSVPEFLVYHLSSSWRLRQSGTRTLKFLFAGRNSGHFFDPSTANRWNIRQNRSKSPRQLMPGVALGVVGIRDSEWARQVDPAGRFLGGNFRVADQD